ncbi:MAG TPA: four helix bundle protein [Gemmatimonadaceae bacterium]|nr:four helix bundle protein [Gemmatimonadaceae bacterium]
MPDRSANAARVRGYRDLDAWNKSMTLIARCYAVARSLPPDERFDLARQLRRASISIAANIAEGSGRRHKADYARFLAIARGSLSEVETYLEIIRQLDFAPGNQTSEALALASDVGKMLTGLLRRHARPVP